MTPDQITAIGSIVISAASASAAIAVRYLSRAGKVIRKLRRGVEAAEGHIYRLRILLIRQGYPENRLPRIPAALVELDSWQTEDPGGVDEDEKD